MSSSVLDQTLIEAFHHLRFDADASDHATNAKTAHWLSRADSPVIRRPHSRNTQCVPSDDEEEQDEQDTHQSSEDEEVEEAFERARLRTQLNKKKMKSDNAITVRSRSTVPLPSEDELSTDEDAEDAEDAEDVEDDDDNDNLLSVKLNTSVNQKNTLQPRKSGELDLRLPFNKSAPTLAHSSYYQQQPQKASQQRHSSDNSHYKQKDTMQSIPQIMLENRSISTDDLTNRYYTQSHQGVHSGSSSSHSGNGSAGRGGAEGDNGEGEEDYFSTSKPHISSSAASSSSHSSPKMHLSMQQQSQPPYQPQFYHPHYSHLTAAHTSTNSMAIQQKRQHHPPPPQPHVHLHQHHPHQHQPQQPQQMRALSGMDLIKQREQEKADSKRQSNKLPRLMNPAQMEAKIEGGLLSRLPQQGTHNINFQQIQQQHEEQMKKFKKEQLQLQQQMAQQQQQQQQLMMLNGYPSYDYYYQQQQNHGLYQLPQLNSSHSSMNMPQQQQLLPTNRPGSALSFNNNSNNSNNNKQRPGTPMTSALYSQYHYP